MVIKNFFREDGASAEEIVKDESEDFGKRLALESEKYASNVTYKNDLTPEDVEAWKESKKDNASKPTPKPKATVKTAPKSGSVFK
jgi:hypothetical protein